MTFDETTRKLLYKVATAYYDDGLTQQEIGARLGLSRIKVSRLLSQAREEGIVKITIVPPPESNADIERALEAQFDLLEAVVVTPGGETDAVLLGALGAAGAQCLVRCLTGAEIVGLSWGTTLHAVIESLPLQAWSDMTVVQILGGLDLPEAEVHGTDLARRMAQRFGARLRLLPAPGVVSSKLVRDALVEDPQIRSTLALAVKADVVLLGIGTPLHGSVIQQSNILSREEIVAIMNKGAVGDISLRFFDSEGRRVEHEVNDRTIGPTLEQIQHIPRRIGVAGGSAKRDVIRGALAGQWINVLVTDEQTALALLKEKTAQTLMFASQQEMESNNRHVSLSPRD